MGFYLVLPSNSFRYTQPENNASRYIIDYENSIDVRGDHELELTEIAFTYNPVTLRQK